MQTINELPNSDYPVIQTFEQMLEVTQMQERNPFLVVEFQILNDFLNQAIEQGYDFLDIFIHDDCMYFNDEPEPPTIAQVLYHLTSSEFSRIYLGKDRHIINLHLLLPIWEGMPEGCTIYDIEFGKLHPANPVADPELITTLKNLLQQVKDKYLNPAS